MLLLEPLQHQLLVDLLLGEHVELPMASQSSRPRLPLMGFLQLDVQLAVLDHPEGCICFSQTENVLVEEGGIALNSDLQMSWLDLDV
eukprot:CAMPEP_0185913278 /NCGR_PEP_ID=MMETSP0196C-20130402/43001_1 /TAXON_ID=2932 /ORGANISM="Alexandrium fundyense, Strain CCMP1719" /LENGTH=86 /DNA_ID=CAMNT_0028634617 /DNA_START=386 /DNA_END=646 /DNA_ORIENTATION=-